MNHATNAAVMRASNRKLIMNMVRLGPISRVELAHQANLTRASVTQIIDELLESGLVESCPDIGGKRTGAAADKFSGETEGAVRLPGRQRIPLSLKHNARFVFGVHISRRRCLVGVVDLYGDVLAEKELLMGTKGPEAIVCEINEIICEQKKQLKLPEEHIIGIGVSAPGPVDHRKGKILNPPNFPQWQNVSICDMLEECTGLTTLLEKDTNARALEEKYFGAGKNISGFMLVQIDEGVGSGVVIHNALYRGTRGMGTEIGHTTIRYDGPSCSCGGRGCLENYLAVPRLLENSRYDSWEELTACPEEEEASRLLDLAAEYLSAALVNAINLYDLEKILLTGEVAKCPEPLLKRLNPLVVARVMSRSSVHEIPVIASGARAPVRTGAMAALYDLFQERG